MVCLSLGFFLGACSFYTVTHTETPMGADGQSKYQTRILSMVPPGGKELSSGNANISAKSGEDQWRIKVGAELDTDMSGTAALIDSLVGRIAELSSQLALMQSGVLGAIPKPAPKAPSGSELNR